MQTKEKKNTVSLDGAGTKKDLDGTTSGEKSKSKVHYTSPNHRQCLAPEVDLLFTGVLTSAHSPKLSGKLITTSKSLSHDQVVVAAGPGAAVKAGDWVRINVDMFPKERKPGKHDTKDVVTIIPPLEVIGGTTYLYLSDRHIKFVIRK